MSKHLTSQRYVFKIHSSRLRRANWNLTLTPAQARENKELISLSESQMLRWIDQLNDIHDSELKISEIKNKLKKQRQKTDITVSKPIIRQLYSELDKYQFKKDYVCIVMDKVRDYKIIHKNGFTINGVRFKRMLGTTGGVKMNTIVMVSEELYEQLSIKVNNGRNSEKEFVPAKLEAYKALTCSSSTPVSMPNGILVVSDCITHFKSDVIELDDTDLDQPSMKFIKDKEVQLNDSDGYGLAMPQLMQRWGTEIGEDFLLPACVIRNSFCKGAVFPIDFQKFARDNNVRFVTDVWGEQHDIFDIELVLTESMLKLWDSYTSISEYLENCQKNGYTFSITKSSEENLENERTSNYQFIQPYDFTDEEIDELIAPTVNSINNILSGDYRKTILYTKGVGLNENNVQKLDTSFATALMIEPEMMKDPYVRNQVYNMIRKRIDDAKVGVLDLPANYSIISGDPYSLCQSMFNLEVTGLLKAGQVYSKYWIDKGVKYISGFRAPMTSINNIRLFEVVHNDIMDEFYKYMTTPTIFNSWDTACDAMNGADKDGDCVINTSFPLIVNKTQKLPAIMCVQRKAPKCIPTEDDMVLANINSFGNAVGEVTNKITSMFEVRSNYNPFSREYRILDYRIKCGQLFQQNAIDKSKGIISKPMPEKWYNWISTKINKGKDSKEKKENWMSRKILAEKKPYFMIYVYPAEKQKYNDYIKKNNHKCLMRFRISLEELLAKENKTAAEHTFIDCYYRDIPVGMGPCTINRICWKIEDMFDGFSMNKTENFDYSILKCDASYTNDLYKKIEKVYKTYQKELATYTQYAKTERIKSDERQIQKYIFKENFKRSCYEICPSEDILCNIVLDMCYSKSNNSKQFAWDICGDVFIQNLLKRNGYKITYPVLDPSGDIEFNGMRFSMKTTEIKVNINMEDTECQSY